MIKLVKELPQLQELHLGQMIDTNSLKEIISLANNLSVLKLSEKYTDTIDKDDFNIILKSVQNRSERINLLIELISNGTEINIPSEILTENREFIYIKEQIEKSDDFKDDSSDEFSEDDLEYFHAHMYDYYEDPYDSEY